MTRQIPFLPVITSLPFLTLQILGVDVNHWTRCRVSVLLGSLTGYLLVALTDLG
ncbi:MAG: hypothetical protein WCP28_03910 [Actinomycetes bacterium]